MSVNHKHKKWKPIFENLQKNFVNDLERSFNKITDKGVEKCLLQSKLSDQLSCMKTIDNKLKDILSKFQKDITLSLSNLESCIEKSNKNSEYTNCVLIAKREIQKDGLLSLDTLKSRIN